MEVKYGNMFDSTLHMQRHPVGARQCRNFLTAVGKQSTRASASKDDAPDRGAARNVPRTGRELQYAVQVLLKTNSEDKRDGLKHFIYQVQVNRARVGKCILGMKRRGRSIYAH